MRTAAAELNVLAKKATGNLEKMRARNVFLKWTTRQRFILLSVACSALGAAPFLREGKKGRCARAFRVLSFTRPSPPCFLAPWCVNQAKT